MLPGQGIRTPLVEIVMLPVPLPNAQAAELFVESK